MLTPERTRSPELFLIRLAVPERMLLSVRVVPEFTSNVALPFNATVRAKVKLAVVFSVLAVLKLRPVVAPRLLSALTRRVVPVRLVPPV